MRACRGSVGLPFGGGTSRTTRSRMSSIPMPVFAEHGMASVASIPITSDFFGRGFGVGAPQVHLVQDRNHLDAEIDRRVAVGDRLRFDALRRVDDEKRPFAGGERTAHFIGKVHVPRGVDEVELVRLAVLGLVLERRGLRLDRDAAFALEVHAVQNLGAHFTVGEPAAALNQAVGERRFAVVDVGDDGKIADILHRHESVERDGGRGEKARRAEGKGTARRRPAHERDVSGMGPVPVLRYSEAPRVAFLTRKAVLPSDKSTLF